MNTVLMDTYFEHLLEHFFGYENQNGKDAAINSIYKSLMEVFCFRIFFERLENDPILYLMVMILAE